MPLRMRARMQRRACRRLPAALSFAFACCGCGGQRLCATRCHVLPNRLRLQVVRVGQRIATIDVRLKDAATGALVAQVRVACWPAPFEQPACKAPNPALPGAPGWAASAGSSCCSPGCPEAALPPLCVCFLLQGTHVKYMAEGEPPMLDLIEKSRLEGAAAMAGGGAGPAAAAAGGSAAASAGAWQGSQQRGAEGMAQRQLGSAGPWSAL